MYHQSGFAFASKTSFYVNFLAWCNFKLETHVRVGSYTSLDSSTWSSGRNEILIFLCLWVSFVSSLPSSEDRAFQRFWLDRILTPNSSALLPTHRGTNQPTSGFPRLAKRGMGMGAA